ncbi:prenylated rab acceptor PRA1 [Neocallimastix californiae]|uniref:PRA1 family protein n=1 Tax=Neocallimastix californiae TaxID=1754190 RepID=A0A1Y2E8L7_9FUNG|nr:prenylated rab acceptor PRA1 [Neocallimastix californiae]|eukprot:ORY67908.1 prenylated rab acceptor PRA1 [Neocallimastix californiae]
MTSQQSSSSNINENDNGGFIGINVPLLSNETFRQIREKRFSMLKPWSDFFDRTRISKPKDLSEATKRISHNLVYFQANYIIIVLILLVYIMITNLLLLFSVVAIGAGFYYVSKVPPNEPVSFFGGKFVADQKKLYIILGILSIILLYLSSGGSALFWIIGVSSTIILVHASLLEPSIESEFAETV